MFAKACAANPDRRYPNAGRFRRDLLLLQSGGSLDRQRWIRRGRVALLIVGGIGGLGMGWWRQEQEARFWRTSSRAERVNRAYRPEYADSWRRHFIPTRPKGTDPRQIDLSRLYNGGTHGDLPRATRVASGSNAALPGNQWSLALHLRSRDNPHPERPVTRVEFESTMQNSALFLAGLTVE